jgi:hypothetical protein
MQTHGAGTSIGLQQVQVLAGFFSEERQEFTLTRERSAKEIENKTEMMVI